LLSRCIITEWQTISKILGNESHRVWDVTLSDFTEKALPSDSDIAKIYSEFLRIRNHTKNIDISKNLISDDNLNRAFNFVLTSYGFDSVWAKEDARYEKIGNGIYKNFEKNQITNEQYGNYISAFFKAENKDTAINFAGGMLARIDELFSLYLKDCGAFISLDITELTNDHLFSGGAAFKPENYKVLVPILNDKGYKTELYSLNDFIEKMEESTPIDLGDHSLLFVSKA
jgi:hypothetical protein